MYCQNLQYALNKCRSKLGGTVQVPYDTSAKLFELAPEPDAERAPVMTDA